MQGPARDIGRMHPPPGKRISVDILIGVGVQAWCPVALKRFVAFAKSENVQENVYRRLCNERLEQDIKSCCKPHLIKCMKLKCSTVRVICTNDQYESAFCALQLTVLISRVRRKFSWGSFIQWRIVSFVFGVRCLW